MKKLAALVAFVVLLLQCHAYEDNRTLEELLSIWFDQLVWTEKAGFSATLVKENPPGHIYIEGHVREKVAADGGALRLEKGKSYFLTNGYGRSQRLRFLDSRMEGTNPGAYRVFRRDEPVLYFEHLERYERGGQPMSRRYVISAKGEVYDFCRNEKGILSLPFKAPVRQSSSEKIKTEVMVSADKSMDLVLADQRQANAWIARSQVNQGGVSNDVFEVCYFERQDQMELCELVLKNKTLDSEFCDYIRQQVDENLGFRRWALVETTGGKPCAVGVCVGLGGGEYRAALFDKKGEVVEILYQALGNDRLKRGDVYTLYGFGENKEVQYFLDYNDGRVNDFWLRENGELSESKDETRAKKLIDEAIARFKQFKRGKK